MKASEILEKVVTVLKDKEYVRWEKPELLAWISEAQTVIARTPGGYVKVANHPLQRGTRQVMPKDSWSLLTVSRNIESNGDPLSTVRVITRSLLDSFNPDWHMDTPKRNAENFVYDDRFPYEFYVYPPNNGKGIVELIYAGIPEAVKDETEELSVDASFAPAIVSYVLYRAVSKDADYAGGATIAAQHFQAFSAALGEAVSTRGDVTPNATLAHAPSSGVGREITPTPIAPNGSTE